MISTAVLAVLVTVAQVGLAVAGDSSKWVGGAHALDGMVILLLSLWLAIAAMRRRRSYRPGRVITRKESSSRCVTRRGAQADYQIDAVDVGTPELTSPRLSHAAGWQVAPVRRGPVAFGL